MRGQDKLDEILASRVHHLSGAHELGKGKDCSGGGGGWGFECQVPKHVFIQVVVWFQKELIISLGD